MTRIMRAELLNVSRDRLVVAAIAASTLMATLQVVFRAFFGFVGAPSPTGLFSYGGTALVFAAVAASAHCAAHDRHSTMTYGLLASPRRWALLLGRSAAIFVFGVVAATITALGAAAGGYAALRFFRDAAYTFGPAIGGQLLAQALAVGLVAVIAAMLTSAFRHSEVAIGALVLWITIGETAIISAVAAPRWRLLPIGAFRSVIRDDGYRLWALAVLAAYAVLCAGLAGARLEQRDYT